MEQSVEAAHTTDVGQLFGGSCTSAGRSVRGAHPEGCRGVGGSGVVGSRQENVFRSPVILHNAGQIRLELTAEDIQLDCARHSVASIRAPASRLCVSCCRKREGSMLCLSVSFPFMSLDFFIICITEHYMLNIEWAISVFDVHCSLFR